MKRTSRTEIEFDGEELIRRVENFVQSLKKIPRVRVRKRGGYLMVDAKVSHAAIAAAVRADRDARKPSWDKPGVSKSEFLKRLKRLRFTPAEQRELKGVMRESTKAFSDT